MRTRARGFGRAGAVLAATLLTVLVTGSPALAAEGTIDHVETTKDGLRILFSVPGIGEQVTPDVETVTTTVEGEELDATAVLASDSSKGVRRTAVLAIDVSRSMAGERFEEAKVAAKAFLEAAPVDVFVGVVAFAGDVRVVQEPTLDHDATAVALDDLELTLQTRLYDGVQEAVRATGTEGQRSVLVLSDGADTSGTPISDVTELIAQTKVKVDVVALAQNAANRQKLETIVAAGKGSVLAADDPKALSQVFEREAQALAKQLLVSAQVPADLPVTEGTVSVSVQAAGQVYTDSAYVTVRKDAEAVVEAVLADPGKAVSQTGALLSPTMLMAGLIAVGLGTLILLLSALGVLTPRRVMTIEDRIAAYTKGAQPGSAAFGSYQARPRPSVESVTGSARAMAERALEGNKGLQARLSSRLDAAGMSMKPAEWLLTHVAIIFSAAIFGMLLGSVVLAAGFLLMGIVVPHVYLTFKKSRRIRAFNDQLADTLQLMGGSLLAGLSLAQSVDTVVREGTEPMTSEFRRALIEARLGVPLEDSLESIAERMQSVDFRWVVMAVRIQREVGGNLAEVLNQVSATIRERAYLRRQVRSLSAEGRLSAWILGSLPVAIVAFLSLSRPEYLEPMVTTGMGWVMIAVAAVLMSLGVLWLRQIVKMEV